MNSVPRCCCIRLLCWGVSERGCSTCSAVDQSRKQLRNSEIRSPKSQADSISNFPSGLLECDDDAGDVVARAAVEGELHKMVCPGLRVGELLCSFAQIFLVDMVRQAVAGQ